MGNTSFKKKSNKKNDGKQLTSIELFAGVGGLMLGASQAGFKHLVAAEWDKRCCETLRMNRDNKHPLMNPDMEIIEADVRKVDWRFARDMDIDLLAGGPPCQPFSLGGLSRAELDSRDMFPTYARILKEVSPKAFILENVKGLTRKTFAGYFNYIVTRLMLPSVGINKDEDWQEHYRRLRDMLDGGIEPEYRVEYHIVDAADYGVPQHRHRVIIVGFRNDVDVDWEFPKPTHVKPSRVNDYKGERLAWIPMREAIEGMPAAFDIDDVAEDEEDPDKLKPALPNHEVVKSQAKSYPGHTGSTLDAPSKAIKAGVHGVPGGENMIRYPDGTLRYLTVREAARIQQFPDDYVFSGGWGDGMKQIGNAVPVGLARQVCQSISDALRKAK